MSDTTKILITGGAGFIGSNLCDYFISKNYQLVCLDNFSTGHRHNIAQLLDTSKNNIGFETKAPLSANRKRGTGMRIDQSRLL